MKTMQGWLLAGLSLFTLSSEAADGISLTLGTSEDAQIAAVAVQWDWEKRWFTEGKWWLGGYWEADASYWRGDGSGENNIYGIGITPVLRLQRDAVGSISPYAEFGIGAHLLSRHTVHDDKNIGTNFQFSEHIGFGFLFGEDQKYDFSYRFQHYSNAGLSGTNPGIDFHELRLGYRF
jgi:lipid A 3-O-deacylase